MQNNSINNNNARHNTAMASICKEIQDKVLRVDPEHNSPSGSRHTISAQIAMLNRSIDLSPPGSPEETVHKKKLDDLLKEVVEQAVAEFPGPVLHRSSSGSSGGIVELSESGSSEDESSITAVLGVHSDSDQE